VRILEWFTQSIDHIAVKLWEFIEEEHTAVSERYLSRAWDDSTTDERSVA
jgi:hypothetical protein